VQGNVTIKFRARVIKSDSEVRSDDKILLYTGKTIIDGGTSGLQGLAHDSAVVVSKTARNLFRTSVHEIFHTLGL
jgi:hypothetical protein